MISLSLIGITVVFSISAWYIFPDLMRQGVFMPYRVFREQRWYQLISGGLLHADYTHLLFNMITLFFFGPFLEKTIGAQNFLMLYLSGLILSSVPSLIRHRNDPHFASLGASGAVEAVLFCFIMLFPLQPIYLFFIPVGIPALLFGFVFVGYSIYASKKQMGQINHDAHLAGAAVGVIYPLLFIPNSLSNFLHQLGF